MKFAVANYRSNKGIGMSNRFTKASLLTGTFMAGAMMISPAYAQAAGADQAADVASAPVDGDLIVVTGSRIQRNTATAAPVAVVAAEEFALSGTVNVENVINSLPQVVPGFTSTSNNPGTGAATLDLRGLGDVRTMVLVNGRRWMFYDTNQVVDLNTIPAFLLDSVDVVTGGASAVYGSDALAGVVNFRLKKVEGIEMGGQYALTSRGDGARYNAYGAIGTSFDDGRGSATVFAEYYNRKSISQGDRGFSRFALGGETDGDPLQQFGSSTLPQGVIRYFGGAQGTGPQRLRDNPNTPVVEPTDDGIGAFANNNAVVFDTPGTFRPRAGDTFNYAPDNFLQIPQERYLLGGYANYEFSDGHEFYTEVSFVNNRVAQELAATPVTGDFNLDLATIQPFLSAASFATLQQIDQTETTRNAANGDPDDPGVVTAFVQRRVNETGSRNSLDERNAFRVLGGVRGDVTDTINYDAYYLYSRTRNANVQAGNISRSAFQAGLDGTGTPINIFGPDTLTPEMVRAISIQAQNGDISIMQVASGVLSGTFGDYAIGTAQPIGFAVGAEYRKVGSQFLPDTALASGDVIGFNAGEPTEGSYNVKEVFAELNIPIEFGSARLDLTGAGRYSDYSLDAVGGVWTYAGGVEFRPIPDITLRGQYQRAVRAPNVGELFGGRAIGFPGAVDPCSQASAATDATIRALCIATGVPATTVGTTAVQINTQIPAIFGGNPNLQEETSDSYTAGIVLQPRMIPGLTITADYFNISVDGAIDTFGGGLNNALNTCYNVVQDINAPECQIFANGARNNAGIIDVGNPPLLIQANTASLETSGVDVEVNYTMTLPFSLMTDTGEQRLGLSFLGTWTDEFNRTPAIGLPVNECAGRFGTTCGTPIPKYKWTSRATFSDGPVTTSLRWRHLGAVRDDDDSTDFSDFNGAERIEAYDLLDVTMSFDINENATFTFGVNNVFDTLPFTPTFNASGEVVGRGNGLLLGDNQEQANTYPSVYDVIGRDFFASVSLKF